MPDIKERLLHLIKRNRRKEQDVLHPVSIDFFDLNDPESAEKRGVEPGYYLTAYPISIENYNDPELMPEVVTYLMEKILQTVPLAENQVKIVVDTDGNFINPSNAWEFFDYGYIEESQLLVILAEKMDQDIATKMAVKAMRK